MLLDLSKIKQVPLSESQYIKEVTTKKQIVLHHTAGNSSGVGILDKLAIGIEICSWGPLDKVGDKFYNYVDREVSADQVTKLDKPYKGHLYYHAYTDAQIESVRQLLVYWNRIHGIPLQYNEDIWVVSDRALKGEAGVFTHNSYRKDKTDIHPCPRMINMLKTL